MIFLPIITVDIPITSTIAALKLLMATIIAPLLVFTTILWLTQD